MISNEIRNEIEGKGDIHESKKIIAGIRKDKNTRIKKRETPAPREALITQKSEQYKKVFKIWTCESRVVRSDLMSVCVKRKVLVHNNNMIN